MSAPTHSQLLDAWERGLGQPPYERALTLLSAAQAPLLVGGSLWDWSIGWRDAALLDLREQLFGLRLACITSCPVCSASLEMNFATADISSPPPPGDAVAFRFAAADGEYEVELRPLSTSDLHAVADAPSRERLLRRCVTAVRHDGRTLGPAEGLPPGLAEEIARRAEAADPKASVELQLACPDCGHLWVAPFDIASFLWDEVGAWAERTLREIHLLASAYGWGEGEILALSPERRRRYLGLVAV